MAIEFGAAAYQRARNNAGDAGRVRHGGKGTVETEELLAGLEEGSSEIEAGEASKATARASGMDSFTKSSAAAEEAEGDEDAASFRADGGHSYSSSAARTGYTVDSATIERLKSENEQRMANLVQMMLGKQISKSNILEAINAGQFTQEDIEQAQKDIADDGYWGVEQTSDRIVQFATALTGGDPDKLDSMIEAFEKGYAEAEKQWGGSLPDITQKTREAVLKKFQDLKDQYANSSGPAAEAAQTVLEAKAQKAAEEA